MTRPPVQVPVSFASELRTWRKAGHWPQKIAADILKVSVRTYQSWEQGVCEPPKVCIRCVRQIMEHDPQSDEPAVRPTR